MQAQREYRIKLRLLEGERILYTIGHHAVSGVAALILPVGILLIVLGLYLYIALGGGFTISRDVFSAGQIDLLDWIVLSQAVMLFGVWLFLGSVERKSYRATRWSMIIMIVFLIGFLIYRVAGWRLFVPAAIGLQPFGPFAVLLLVLAAIIAAQALYVLVDLINDQLILTNMRVIYFNGAVLIPYLIEKQVQRDVMLEDIQNVASRTETYLQHWLRYGTIIVQTANQDAPLFFRAANDAREMQRRIMTERQHLLQQQTERDFDSLIATRVYEDKSQSATWSYPFRVLVIPRILRWLLNDNPLVDHKQRSLTWYPHWVFLVRDLTWPLGTLATAVALMVPIALFGWADPPLLIGIGVLLCLICFFWMVYQLEDYRNDRYMLTPTAVIDIEKKPFGPEGRRSASLGNIQTVTLKTSFISNVFGYGDIVMTTAGTGGDFTFCRIPRPREVAATINQAISVYRKGDRDRSLDEALQLLREFHEAQLRTGELRQHG